MEKSLNFEYILHTCAGAELFLINIFFFVFFLLFLSFYFSKKNMLHIKKIFFLVTIYEYLYIHICIYFIEIITIFFGFCYCKLY